MLVNKKYTISTNILSIHLIVKSKKNYNYSFSLVSVDKDNYVNSIMPKSDFLFYFIDGVVKTDDKMVFTLIWGGDFLLTTLR